MKFTLPLIVLLVAAAAYAASEMPATPKPTAIPESEHAPKGPAVANESKVPEKIEKKEIIVPEANATGTAIAPESEKKTVKASNSRLIKNAPLLEDHVMGDKKAKLVLVEYVSLSCPHCAHFNSNVLPDLIKNYVDTGKMRYVLRQYPGNEPALRGAMLVDCVGEKDSERYFTFNRVLLDAQSKWAFDGNWMEELEAIAGVGGVSKEQFKKCMTSTERETKILKARKDAADELGIPHTPYIFIGGEAYEGQPTLDGVSKVIDAKLAAK